VIDEFFAWAVVFAPIFDRHDDVCCGFVKNFR
jgi:hypothetical protein